MKQSKETERAFSRPSFLLFDRNSFSTDPAAPITCKSSICLTTWYVSRKREDLACYVSRKREDRAVLCVPKARGKLHGITAVCGNDPHGAFDGSAAAGQGGHNRPESRTTIPGASTGLCRHETAFPAFGVTEPGGISGTMDVRRPLACAERRARTASRMLPRGHPGLGP